MSLRTLLLIASLVGCSSSTEPPAVDDTPRFEKDIVPLFERSCGAKDNECHSRVAYHPNPKEGCRGWLSLENAAIGSKYASGPKQGQDTGCPDVGLYDRLKHDAWECGPPYFADFPRKKYVEPGKPEASHLFNKVAGGPQCGIPNAMPKGGTANPKDVEILRKWILAGAPR